ncbi:hypothetical protein [Ekhidna sp.]
MKFTVENISYLERFKQKFLLRFIIVIASTLVIYFQGNDQDFALGIILILGILFGISAHISSSQYFYHVELTKGKILLKGDNIGNPLQVELPIHETEISFERKGNREIKINYFIQLQHQAETYKINRFFNWNYAELVGFFKAYKDLKKEKIAFDEEEFLKEINQKIEDSKQWIKEP